MPVCYRLVQPFPPEYFRQEIGFHFKLRIAGRYFLRQGLFYAVLIFIGMCSRQKNHLPFKINPAGLGVSRVLLNLLHGKRGTRAPARELHIPECMFFTSILVLSLV